MSSFFKEDLDYLEMIKNHLDKKDMKYDIHEGDEEGEAYIFLNVSFGKIPGIPLQIRVDNEGLVSFRVYIASNVPDDKVIEMLETINMINKGFRFIKVVLDSDNDIRVDSDFFVIAGTDQENLFSTTLSCYLSSLDDCYPLIMHALWS